jgi:hypothetical protein
MDRQRRIYRQTDTDRYTDRHSSVRIMTKLKAQGPGDRASTRVRAEICLLGRVLIGSGVRPVSYAMSNEDSFPEGKATGA